jgi:hypothetical protein
MPGRSSVRRAGRVSVVRFCGGGGVIIIGNICRVVYMRVPGRCKGSDKTGSRSGAMEAIWAEEWTASKRG